jgi:hypothetical protein
VFRQKRRAPYQLQTLPTRRPSRRPAMLVVLIATPVALLAATAAAFAFHAAHAAAPAAAAAPNPNCSLIVPANPLSATGLATPYQLTATNAANGPCNEANINQSAFVEAAILTPAGQLSLYDPLVIDRGTQPAATPVPAQVPAGSAVGIWFGFNGTTLTLRSGNGNSLAQGNCVNGSQGSVFGQFAYCGAPAFFRAANRAIANKTLTVPPAGTAKDGAPCPTTRDFSLVDQDQSDNVVTHYLANGNGQIAQNNKAAAAAVANATDLANGSDNLLLDQFVDPALGCTPFTAPDQSSDMQPSGSLPLDELSAAASQQAPIALVPRNDPMTLVGNNQSITKTNAYRAGVDQQPIGGGGDNGDAATYCRNMFGNAAGIQRVFKDQAMLQNAPSVDPAMATNLFTFLAMRANQSFTNLGCGNLLNEANPITLTMDGNQVVTAATLGAAGTTPCTPGTTTTTTANPTTTTTGTTTTTTTVPSGTTTAAGAPTTTASGTTTATSSGTTTTTTGMPSTTTPAMPTTTTTSGACTPGTTTSAPTSTGRGGTTHTNHPPDPWRIHHRPRW